MQDWEKYTSILEKITQEDQIARDLFHKGKLSVDALSEVDKKNHSIIIQVLDIIGFPTLDKTSENAYLAVIVTALHTTDIPFLEKIITQMEQAPEGTVRLKDLAYLIDKKLVLQNKLQKYGTQFKKENNKVTFFEIENLELLDVRRFKMGLEPFEIYREKVS